MAEDDRVKDYDEAMRYLEQAAHGLWRVRPIYYKEVDPLRPDENLIEGFDLYRGNRHVRVYLTDINPTDAFRFRRELVDRLASRVSRDLQPFMESDGSFKDDVTITPVYRNGRPVQLIISRPGARPLRIAARDFVGVLKALRDKNEVILHGTFVKDGKQQDFWVVGNKKVMEPLGMYIQQGQLPLDYFTQKGNVLFLNADAVEQALFGKKLKMQKVKYVRRSIWGWSP